MRSKGIRAGDVIQRSKVIKASMSFEITIPQDIPKENIERYAVERFKKLCEKLNAIKGVKVSYFMN